MYTTTDVGDLHEWMVEHISVHPLFRRLTSAEYEGDVCLKAATEDTEEGVKVTRNNGEKFVAVYERIEDVERDWVGFNPLRDGAGDDNDADVGGGDDDDE